MERVWTDGSKWRETEKTRGLHMGFGGMRTRVRIVFLLLFITLVAEAFVFDAQAQKKAVVTGVVLDEDGFPIRGANVTLLTFYHRSFVKMVKTDSAGRFYTSVNKEGSYLVYVTYDNKDTPGIDYVPDRWRTWLSSNSISSHQFILKRGASLYLDGEIRYVKTSRIATSYKFIVLELEGNAEKDYWNGPVREYGSFSDLFRFLGFDERLVVVPADTKVKIEVKAYFPGGYSHTFILAGRAGYFKASQGEALSVDVRESNIISNIEYVNEILNSGFILLDDCRTAGFMVELERQGLSDAYSKVKESLLLLRNRQFDHSFAKLRSAYITASRIKSMLEELIQSGSQSLLPSLFLFLFVAYASAHLIVEKSACLEITISNMKYLISVTSLAGAIFYILLIIIFYLVFPGCRLIPQLDYVIMGLFVLISGKIAEALLVRFSQEKESRNRSIQFKSAVAAAFSLGIRNLRRRRMRTIINLISIILFISGFITLTSISPGYGLLRKELKPALPVDALLVRDEPLAGSPQFISLPDSFIEWLESRPNVTLILPKAENSPVSFDNPLGRLYSESGKWMNVLGVIGIIPSKEANITGIDRVIEEGSYLEDDDLKGIIISSSLRESLEVDVGDRLYGFGREFIIRGFFSDEVMRKIVDVNGQTFLPYAVAENLLPCPEENVIIVTYEEALTLPRVSTSRVVIQLNNTEDYESLARIIALTYDYKTYVSHPGSLTLHSLESYVEMQGVLGVFPLMVLVMLNIGMSMFAAVNERRNEIATLSSLGLNPMHVAALFVAEALIIGFIGGAFGYLLGISGYRLASLIGGLQVREKVSVEWGIISVLVSGLTAITASLIPALRSSTLVTPSLLRRWRIEEEERPVRIRTDKPYVLDLPIKLISREIESFTAFIIKRLQEDEKVKDVDQVKLEEASGKEAGRKIRFVYSLPEMERTMNEIVIQPGEKGYDLKLVCDTRDAPSQPLEAIRTTATYVRKIILEWSAATSEVLTLFDPYLSRLYNLVNAYSPSTLYIISIYPEIHDKIDTLRNALVSRGIRPPKFIVSRIDPQDLEETMNTVRDLVSRVDIVCVSGEDVLLCAILAMEAAKQNKIICYVIDDRSVEERIKNPFQELKIMDVS